MGGVGRAHHHQGHFSDDATALPEYAELDPDFIEPHTSFIVLPYFCGGDLKGLIAARKAQGGARMKQSEVLGYVNQVRLVLGCCWHWVVHSSLRIPYVSERSG